MILHQHWNARKNSPITLIHIGHPPEYGKTREETQQKNCPVFQRRETVETTYYIKQGFLLRDYKSKLSIDCSIYKLLGFVVERRWQNSPEKAARLAAAALLRLFSIQKPWLPYVPIPSASGFGVGFGYLNTFSSQGIWSTREYSFELHNDCKRKRKTHFRKTQKLTLSHPVWKHLAEMVLFFCRVE